MDRPVPAPREGKRPIPTPRRNIPKSNQNQSEICEISNQAASVDTVDLPVPVDSINKVVTEENVQKKVEISVDHVDNSCMQQGKIMEEKDQFSTFSRRVTNKVTNASKQIAGDLGQLVNDRKKAVIEGTRQSVRRLTRRFSSASQEQRKLQKEEKNIQDYEGTIEMFNNIRFDSPLNRADSIYSNVENDEFESCYSSNESLNLPPPKHPPPPLPMEESVYDAPSSSSPVTSSNNSSNSGKASKKTDEYENVFPSNPYNSDSESCIDSTERKLENTMDQTRSASWAFYDSVILPDKEDHMYGQVGPKVKTTSSNSSQDNKKDVTEVLSPEKVPDIRVEKAESIVSTPQSFYENHEIETQLRERTLENSKHKTRPTKSVIMQFDPLSRESSVTQFSDMNLLEEILQKDLYGNISEAYTFDDGEWSISNESEGDDFLNPPTPPARFDSLPEEDGPENETTVEASLAVKVREKTKESEKKIKIKKPEAPRQSNSNWFIDSHVAPSRPTLQRKTSWLKQVTKNVLDKAPPVFKGHRTSDNLIDRPILGGNKFVNKKGMLYKVQGGPVEDLFGEYSGRWCVLENADLFCYSDNTCMHLREHFPASSVLSIQLLQDAKYKYRYDNDDLHCFELNITGKSRGGHIYGSRSISERRIWLQFLAEMLTQRFKSRLTTNFIRMGWAYIRTGVSGKWAGAWLILTSRELHYAIDGHSVKTMDLRKARCIVLQAYQESDNNPRTNDKGPNLLVDCPDMAIYLRMWTSRETKVWCHIVKLEAHNNGANIDQQQLTKNDIPVIVEKCINFIYAHGSMSEGIYRKAGQSSAISDLLSKFRKDAFAVQLTKNNYSEYEVGTALKRFFRELPEPLFGCDHRQYLYEVAKHNVLEEKIRMFKAALDQLPSVSYKTARKLLGHLHFISNQSHKNLMSIPNLAAIWGPTLMHYDDKEKPSKTNTSHVQDAEVVSQLIRYYRNIFPEDPGELEKEKLMLKVLQKHMESPQGSVNQKTAGDLRVWIYLFHKDGKAFNVAIGPNRTAYEVCVELSDKMKSPVHEIILEEVALGDRLFRPIHHTEKVLDVVLKWSYWDEADRKDNYLTCVALSKYWEYIIDKPLPISGDLKFAESKTKLFKTYMFQFTQGCLSCFKDKTSDINLYTWRIEDITWYLGHESKRNPQSRWTMTFLENNSNPSRTRLNPYFGNVLVWNDAGLRANWLSAMLKSRYPNNLTPPPKLLTI